MSLAGSWSGIRLYTIGHSTRTLDELLTLLDACGVDVLVDVRTVPRSRRHPQFNRDTLPTLLPAGRIRYVHLPALGGLRHARKDSVTNSAWHNASFRGYADYMQTQGFEEGLVDLRTLAAKQRVALMCAEAVPWRCHRSLIADVLTSRGAAVEHIIGPGHPRPHRLTPFAKVEDRTVTYPGEEAGNTRLITRGPFHLEATVRVLQRRPTNLVDRWEDGRYVRVLRSERGHAVVEVDNGGTIDAPDVRVSMRLGKEAVTPTEDVLRAVREILGLDVDPAPLQKLADAERKLRPTASALRGMRPPRFPALFETFANVIPFQQVSLDAGVAVVRRLVERFGTRVEDGERVLYAFPEADVVADARLPSLRRCGLSARKAESLRSLAREVASGGLIGEMLAEKSTADALETLTELPGIGPWSAALVLLRGFRRLDVFPSGDVGVQRGLGALLSLESPAALQRVVERFGDRRGYLYFCSLGANLLERGLIHPAP